MKIKKLLAIILAMSIMLVGCSSYKDETNSSKEEFKSSINSEYIHLTMVKPTTINPVLNNDKDAGYIMNLIYDGLFTIDQDYNTVPQLVDQYSVDSDGKSMHIKLKDATWHDGKSVSSDDVKFTINLIQKNTDSPYNELIKNISAVNVINNKELTIEFKEQYAFSKDTLIFPIVSSSALGGKDAKDILSSNNLIGNGPYKIDKMDSRGSMTLIANKDYYEELPETIKDIKVTIVPSEEDKVSMVLALESDIASILLRDLSKFYEDEFNITKYEGRDYDSIIFNYDNKYLNDVNFRKAIAYSIDRETILEESYNENAKLVNFPLNTKSKYYDDKLKSLSFDKTKAEEYLMKMNPTVSEENQGIENNTNNIDNVDTKSDSKDKEDINNESNENKQEVQDVKKELTHEEIKELISKVNLKIIVNKDNEERIKAANIVSDNLSDIGIKSTIEVLTSQEMSVSLSNKDYDLAFVGWELSSIPDARSIIEASGYSDEKVTEYLNSLTIATSDSQISSIYKNLQKYLRDKVAFISLVIRDEYIVTNRRLEGESEPNDFDVYEGISNLTIKK